MPYIKQDDRKRFDEGLNAITKTIETEGFSRGDLNYLISKLSALYTIRRGRSYSICNDVVGVLSCASMGYYRRVVAPYENDKIEQNGDVY